MMLGSAVEPDAVVAHHVVRLGKVGVAAHGAQAGPAVRRRQRVHGQRHHGERRPRAHVHGRGGRRHLPARRGGTREPLRPHASRWGPSAASARSASPDVTRCLPAEWAKPPYNPIINSLPPGTSLLAP
jgi:hypothetical protein